MKEGAIQGSLQDRCNAKVGGFEHTAGSKACGRAAEGRGALSGNWAEVKGSLEGGVRRGNPDWVGR